MSYGISRQEEANLPVFHSHEEAYQYFYARYGSNFVLTGTQGTKEKIYFYDLILDQEAYQAIKEDPQLYKTLDEKYMYATQQIEIYQNGVIHIIH